MGQAAHLTGRQAALPKPTVNEAGVLGGRGRTGDECDFFTAAGPFWFDSTDEIVRPDWSLGKFGFRLYVLPDGKIRHGFSVVLPYWFLLLTTACPAIMHLSSRLGRGSGDSVSADVGNVATTCEAHRRLPRMRFWGRSKRHPDATPGVNDEGGLQNR